MTYEEQQNIAQKIDKIEINNGDVSFYFEGDSCPYSYLEFVEGTATRVFFETINALVSSYNKKASNYQI